MLTFNLDYDSPVNPRLQREVEAIDFRVRARHEIRSGETAVGVLNLKTLQLALLNPDQLYYGASLPKIGILLAWFETHPEAAGRLDPVTRKELGLMIKASSNEIAAKFSQELGLECIRTILNSYRFYEPERGGGIWLGKHYGMQTERQLDPVGGHSHAATVRKVLRFYLLLEQGKLISSEVCARMREVFLSPDIPHHDDKFVRGLPSGLNIMRKSGTWEQWHHDSAIVSGAGRHYILVALTASPAGDGYLGELASAVDQLL